MLGYFDFCEHESVHQSSNNLLKLQLHSESLKMKSVRNEFNINEINYKVISNCMPFILKIISRDMISKSTLLSTLSIAVITKIALLENKFSCLMKYSFGKRWFSFIVLEDRLIQLVHVLFRINQKLIDAIQNMRRKNIIYQFKSIMSFITEIATEKSCCTLLIDCNIFELWNNSSFLNKYFLNKILSQKEMSTNLAQSYFQLLNSSLRLIITMLMIYNNKIIHQLIFTFLLKHEDVFHLVLNRSLFLNISFQSIKFLLYVWKLCLEGPLNLIDRSNYPNKKNKYTCLLEKQNKTWKNIFKYIIQRINKTKKFNTSKQYRTWKDKTAINDEIYEILRILLLLFLIGTSFIFFNDCRFLSKVKKKMFTIAGSKKIFGPLPKTLISLFEIICIKLNSSISLKTELEFDQIQIKDSMEKYLPKNNDIHFQNHVLKKKYAENFLEIKLSKTNLCIQKLFSMIENIFFLFYCNCLFFFKIDDLEQKRAFRFFLFENISKIRFLNNRIQKNIKLIHGQSFFGNNYFLKSLIQKIEDLIK